MTEIQRDELLIELRSDVKWLKDFAVEHKATHTRYLYFFVLTAVGLILALIK